MADTEHEAAPLSALGCVGHPPRAPHLYGHADNGTSMTSKTVSQLLPDLKSKYLGALLPRYRDFRGDRCSG
jgi:hypothetical protein